MPHQPGQRTSSPGSSASPANVRQHKSTAETGNPEASISPSSSTSRLPQQLPSHSTTTASGSPPPGLTTGPSNDVLTSQPRECPFRNCGQLFVDWELHFDTMHRFLIEAPKSPYPSSSSSQIEVPSARFLFPYHGIPTFMYPGPPSVYLMNPMKRDLSQRQPTPMPPLPQPVATNSSSPFLRNRTPSTSGQISKPPYPSLRATPSSLPRISRPQKLRHLATPFPASSPIATFSPPPPQHQHPANSSSSSISPNPPTEASSAIPDARFDELLPHFFQIASNANAGNKFLMSVTSVPPPVVPSPSLVLYSPTPISLAFQHSLAALEASVAVDASSSSPVSLPISHSSNELETPADTDASTDPALDAFDVVEDDQDSNEQTRHSDRDIGQDSGDLNSRVNSPEFATSCHRSAPF